MEHNQDGTVRKNIRIGSEVEVLQKQHQGSGVLTEGIVDSAWSEIHQNQKCFFLSSDAKASTKEIKQKSHQ